MKEIKFAISGSNGFIGGNLAEHVGGATAINRKVWGVMPKAEYYIDCAAYGNMSSHKDAEEIYKANLTRLVIMLHLTKKVDYRMFVVTSTSSVTLPVQTPYSMSKKAAEDYALWFAKEDRKPIVVVRPYTITGTSDRPEHLIPTLIRSCLYGEEMPFVGIPVHDFLDVDDYCTAIDCIRDNINDFRGTIVNIGSGVSTSNEEILKLVQEITGKEANLKWVDSLRKYDTLEWRADTFALSAKGWAPQTTLYQTIERMVEHERRTRTTNS